MSTDGRLHKQRFLYHLKADVVSHCAPLHREFDEHKRFVTAVVLDLDNTQSERQLAATTTRR